MTPDPRITTPLAMMVIELPRLMLRSRLKLKALTTGFVDGAWWFRSREPSTELPVLIPVPTGLGCSTGVSYQLSALDRQRITRQGNTNSGAALLTGRAARPAASAPARRGSLENCGPRRRWQGDRVYERA